MLSKFRRHLEVTGKAIINKYPFFFRVRKQYGKILSTKRLERNYEYFYKIRIQLLTAAQCKIAFVWRMNRIKIKLARKKREKEEAAKKKL